MHTCFVEFYVPSIAYIKITISSLPPSLTLTPLTMSKAPPPGIYVPAVVFFDETEDIDEKATTAHIRRLAEVQYADYT